jgi:hypothetical protein
MTLTSLIKKGESKWALEPKNPCSFKKSSPIIDEKKIKEFVEKK